MPFHYYQQPHPLVLFICTVTNENPYIDQANGINKCCGLDGACGEPEKKMLYGRGQGGKKQLLNSTWMPSFGNTAQYYQIFKIFKGSWKFGFLQNTMGQNKTRNLLFKPRFAGWLSLQPLGCWKARWAKEQETGFSWLFHNQHGHDFDGSFYFLGPQILNLQIIGEVRWSPCCCFYL